jgi:DNA-binding response OmpR family regulator
MADRSHILVVDDDLVIQDVLKQQLSREGFRVTTASNYEEMIKYVDDEMPDLVILDVLLPDMDGFSIARELRSRSDVGIIMLTGKGDTVDKIVGLEIGADDYVTKPFDQRELLARVNSTLRRTRRCQKQPSSKEISIVTFADWRINLTAHELISPKGEEVHLTHYEFQLLNVFVNNVNRALSRDRIMDLVRGQDWSPIDRTVDVLVGKLRRKIEPDPKKPTFIKTVWGIGYKFTPPVEMLEA